jgi:geranylgeranyl transferase type-2 subunit beta
LFRAACAAISGLLDREQPVLESYLQRLTAHLSDGAARLPVQRHDKHAAYLRAGQQADGGWPGREGGSDLYYTGFALRGLSVLDELTPEVCSRAAAFLRSALRQQTSVVDFFSFLYACLLVQTGGGPDVLVDSPPDWPDRVAATLETFRTADGGYNKSPGASSGSTYHTFLVGLCYHLLNRPFPDPAAVARFTLSRRREDGGFVEVAAMRRSGTNPTAAAIGLLQLTDALTDAVREATAAYLADAVSDEGGLRANGRVPLADLLSTFTGLWTLQELGCADRVDPVAAARFASSVERAQGGFHGGLWDDGHDVEYTFYGLGTLALLTPEIRGQKPEVVERQIDL